MNETHEITDLLQAWSRGDSDAFSKLIPLVNHELKKIARAKMAMENAGHILQTTALVNEALMRLMGKNRIDWQSRTHFYRFVAKRMRQVLIEYARKVLTEKRGGRADHIDVTEAVLMSPEKSEELIRLNELLTELTNTDELKAKIIEYRYFGGFTVKEVADMLDISPSTVEREWRFARAWLKREMIRDRSKP
jgi:RNA polymerase sigma-70 factor (ECF subfamily)